VAPAFEKVSAIDFPMPRDAPVMTATLFFKSKKAYKLRD